MSGRFLIDTNVLISLLFKTVDKNTDALIGDYSNQVYISSVAVMEFINLLQFERIALSKKKHFDVRNVFDFVENTLGIAIKYIDKGHLRTLTQLPTFPTHKDPNDRLMIAQAIAEGLTMISSDTKFHYYVDFGLDFIKAKHE